MPPIFAFFSCKTQRLVFNDNLTFCEVKGKFINISIVTKEEARLFQNAEKFRIDSVLNFIGIHNIIPDSAFFHQFLYELTPHIPRAKETFSFVLYYQLPLHDNDTLKAQQIKGFSLYSFHQKFLYHQFYEKVAGNFREIPALSAKTSMIATKPITDIARDIVFPRQKNFAILMVDKPLTGVKYLMKGPEGLQPTVDQFISSRR